MEKDYKITIDEVEAFDIEDGEVMKLNIRWDSNIGWGETDFKFTTDGTFTVYTEHMCTNDDKEFLYQLMKALVDKCEVVG